MGRGFRSGGGDALVEFVKNGMENDESLSFV